MIRKRIVKRTLHNVRKYDSAYWKQEEHLWNVRKQEECDDKDQKIMISCYLIFSWLYLDNSLNDLDILFIRLSLLFSTETISYIFWKSIKQLYLLEKLALENQHK